MDFHNRVETFEEILMLDPENPTSQDLVDTTISDYHFFGQVYAHKDQFMNKENLSKELPMVPKTMFLPSEALMKQMIDANLKYGRKERLANFLLRFGCV